jgi:RNA polymerase sigma-70 factor (ECF subfamily)
MAVMSSGEPSTSSPMSDPDEAFRARLVAAHARGSEAVGQVFEEHRARLKALIGFRMDRRLRQRLDPSDVIQETLSEAYHRLDEYLGDPKLSPFLWLRLLTIQKLVTLHRHHLDRDMRTLRRERTLEGAAGDTSTALAEVLADHHTAPDDAVVREEIRRRLHESLERMEPGDREVLALRHFEELSNIEAAEILGLEPAAASKRYIRALEKLRVILTDAGLAPR